MRILAGATTALRRIVDLGLVILIVVVLLGVVLGKGAPLVGRQSIVIGGGSMEPTIALGAAIIVRPVDPAALAVGDVVSMQVGPEQTTFTHRIVALVERADGRWIRTQGDANAAPDPTLVPAAPSSAVSSSSSRWPATCWPCCRCRSGSCSSSGSPRPSSRSPGFSSRSSSSPTARRTAARSASGRARRDRSRRAGSLATRRRSASRPDRDGEPIAARPTRSRRDGAPPGSARAAGWPWRVASPRSAVDRHPIVRVRPRPPRQLRPTASASSSRAAARSAAPARWLPGRGRDHSLTD